MTRLDARKRESIVASLRAGTMRAEVARAHGVDKTTVSRIAKAEGMPPRRNEWTDAEVEFLRENYWRMGPRKSAKVLFRHPNPHSVAHKASELGLTTMVGPYGRLRVIDGGKEA